MAWEDAILDVRQFAPPGTLLDGTVDWQPYIQAALDEAMSRTLGAPGIGATIPSTVFLPPGEYRLGRPLRIDRLDAPDWTRKRASVRLVGPAPSYGAYAGGHGAVLYADFDDQPMIVIQSASAVSIEDIQLVGANEWNSVYHVWSPLAPIQAGAQLSPTLDPGSTNPAGHCYRALNSGTTAESEPFWPTNPGGRVTDGDVVWQEFEAYRPDGLTGNTWDSEDNFNPFGCRDDPYSPHCGVAIDPYGAGVPLSCQYPDYPDWSAESETGVGTILRPLDPDGRPITNGHFYVAIESTGTRKTGSTRPTTWPTDGETLVDGDVMWQESSFGVSGWYPGVEYAVGDVVQPVGVLGRHCYRCIGAGTSGSVPPIWPTAVGGKVTEAGDDRPTWREVGPNPPPFWRPATEYGNFSVVRRGSAGDASLRYAKVYTPHPYSSGPIEPSILNYPENPWPLEPGSTVEDGTVTWQAIAEVSPPNWQGNTEYGIGDVVRPTVAGANGRRYRCIVAGMSGDEGEPEWPIAPGSTVEDGDDDLVWQEIVTPYSSRFDESGDLVAGVASRGIRIERCGFRNLVVGISIGSCGVLDTEDVVLRSCAFAICKTHVAIGSPGGGPASLHEARMESMKTAIDTATYGSGTGNDPNVFGGLVFKGKFFVNSPAARTGANVVSGAYFEDLEGIGNVVGTKFTACIFKFHPTDPGLPAPSTRLAILGSSHFDTCQFFNAGATTEPIRLLVSDGLATFTSCIFSSAIGSDLAPTFWITQGAERASFEGCSTSDARVNRASFGETIRISESFSDFNGAQILPGSEVTSMSDPSGELRAVSPKIPRVSFGEIDVTISPDGSLASFPIRVLGGHDLRGLIQGDPEAEGGILSHCYDLLALDTPIDVNAPETRIPGALLLLGKIASINIPEPAGEAWTPGTRYAEGTVVRPATSPGLERYRATDVGISGSVEPTWPTTVGTTVVDNTGPNQITWECISDQWQAGTAYSAGDVVRPIAGATVFLFRALASGTSAGSEPTWPTDPDDLGDPVPDGSGGTAFDWEPIEATIVTLRSVPMVLTPGVRTLALSLVWWPRVHQSNRGALTEDDSTITNLDHEGSFIEGERIMVLDVTNPLIPVTCFDEGVFVIGVDGDELEISRPALQTLSKSSSRVLDADVFVLTKNRAT